MSRYRELSPAIPVFVAINFVLCGLAFLGLVLMACVLVFGVLYSDDQGEDLADGIVGCIVLGLPMLAGVVVYFIAGLGLSKRRTWGYYFHLAGAVLTALSCLGIVYTVLAFVFALRPEFQEAFFPRYWDDDF